MKKQKPKIAKITRYVDIPGWGSFRPIHKALLSTLRSDCNILEVGVGVGRSTWSILDNMRDSMSLYVVDSFLIKNIDLWDNYINYGSKITLKDRNFKKHQAMSNIYTQKEMFLNNISQHPRFSQIKEIYPMSSQEYISLNKKNIFDFVFLDGDHSYETVKSELEYFKDSEILAGHDYDNKDWPGVNQAVHEFVEKYENRTLQIYPNQYTYVIKYNK